MPTSRPSIIEKLIPFVFIGIAIAFAIALFIVFSYVFVWGLIIGVILWVFFAIKNLFMAKSPSKKKTDKGRIIEHEKKK